MTSVVAVKRHLCANFPTFYIDSLSVWGEVYTERLDLGYKVTQKRIE